MLSWVFIILTLTTLAEGTNYFGDSYESVEYGEDENGVYDYSTLIEESNSYKNVRIMKNVSQRIFSMMVSFSVSWPLII